MHTEKYVYIYIYIYIYPQKIYLWIYHVLLLFLGGTAINPSYIIILCATMCVCTVDDSKLLEAPCSDSHNWGWESTWRTKRQALCRERCAKTWKFGVLMILGCWHRVLGFHDVWWKQSSQIATGQVIEKYGHNRVQIKSCESPVASILRLEPHQISTLHILRGQVVPGETNL